MADTYESMLKQISGKKRDSILTQEQIEAFTQGVGSDKASQLIQKNLKAMKEAVKNGVMSLVDMQEYATPIVENAWKTGQTWFSTEKGTGLGQELLGFLQNEKFVQDPSKGTMSIPFTKQEYAKLPEGVLPTKNDVKQGLFDETIAPIRIYRPEAPTPGQPIKPEVPGPGTPTPPYTGPDITDELGKAVVTDERQRQIEEEALRQTSQSKQQAEYQKTERAKLLSDLGAMLTQRTQSRLNEKLPGVYEDLNTRGLLRSSELGNATAREARSLEEENQLALKQAALGYGEANIADIAAILAKQQGFQSAGLQARLGLEDAKAQEQLAITLAELSKPSSPQGKTSGEKWADAIQTGASLIPKK